VCNRDDGTVSRVDASNHGVIDLVEVGGTPTGIAVDGQRGWIIVKGEARLVAVNADDTAQIASSTFGGSPLGLAVQGDEVSVTQSEFGTVRRVKALS
jgi:YVTN family beta-propeller protein